MVNKDYQTISFYKFAQSMGAVEINNNDIDKNELLLKAFIFLNKDIVLTKKQEQEYEIFKDRYNRYLEYCIKNNFANSNLQEIKSLNITTVPDMSKIIIPDIKKELEEMDIDLSKLGDIFKQFSKN
jgi:hypothetical protein